MTEKGGLLLLLFGGRGGFTFTLIGQKLWGKEMAGKYWKLKNYHYRHKKSLTSVNLVNQTIA
jgi:hypothetical protein